MKLDQILVCCMTNISNLFLAQGWRLDTSSRPFMILLKWQYSKIWPFLIFDFYQFSLSLINLFTKMNFWNLDMIGYWHYWITGAGPQSSKLLKRFLKIIPLAHIYQFAKFGDLICYGSKDIFKNVLCLIYQYSSWIQRFGK